eukprot:Nitzschia sp. Nitz4//scaffold8_size234185//38303//38977//NITZ4_001235-RA/size234185-processed-gene-0.258-mRNA-1//1//CDS//3329559740//278//frame0
MSTGNPTRESMQALLANAPFSASSKTQLETYVDLQATGEAPYYMDANRHLMKHYQFLPQSRNDEKVAVVLLLALLEFPSTDVLALRYLIPDRVQSSGTCADIMRCQELLESCKFAEFWPAFKGIEGGASIQALLGEKSVAKLRCAIVEVLAVTYRAASLDQVLLALNMSNKDQLSELAHPSVESVGSDEVKFVATAENTKRTRVFQEGVTYSSIATMMAKVSSE